VKALLHLLELLRRDGHRASIQYSVISEPFYSESRLLTANIFSKI
jgi:hypothetical protein